MITTLVLALVVQKEDEGHLKEDQEEKGFPTVMTKVAMEGLAAVVVADQTTWVLVVEADTPVGVAQDKVLAQIIMPLEEGGDHLILELIKITPPALMKDMGK